MTTAARDARQGTLRRLGPGDQADLLRLCALDPVANAFVESRVRTTRLDPWRLGGPVWGYYDDGGTLVSACYAGGNLVPVEAGPHALAAFAREALRSPRRYASIFGPAEAVTGLWARLAPAWGPAREERMDQPLLACRSAPTVAPDPAVRAVRADEVELLLPACVAMFTEEVGVPPYGGGASPAYYREGVVELVAGGRAFARIEDGTVVFKAEAGAVTPAVAQVQGVWVTPERRGQGLSVGGMAAVVALARQRLAPVVSLYVNDYNRAALAAYVRVGFRQVGTFATVLF